METPETPGEVEDLVKARANIERRIRELEEELRHLRTILSVLDAQIAERSFRRAELALSPLERARFPETFKQVIPLKAKTGDLLANLYVGDDILKVTPGEGVAFNVTTPPFQAFLIDRVFSEMIARDQEKVKTGELAPEKVFSYEVVREGDFIREIVIWNYRDQSRLREVRSSLRWTLERMAEKTGILRAIS